MPGIYSWVVVIVSRMKIMLSSKFNFVDGFLTCANTQIALGFVVQFHDVKWQHFRKICPQSVEQMASRSRQHFMVWQTRPCISTFKSNKTIFQCHSHSCKLMGKVDLRFVVSLFASCSIKCVELSKQLGGYMQFANISI